MKRRLLAMMLFVASEAHAEVPYRFDVQSYLSTVLQGNLDLVAERANVPIARAQIDVAKGSFPDPQLTGGLLQYDVTQKGNPTATTLGLYVPMQIAGQRGGRIDVARSGALAAESDLEDFRRGLRAAAANAYVDGLHARLIADLKKRTLTSLEKLVAVNEQRLKSGDIGEVVLVQSRVEAHQFRAQVVAAEGDVRAADIRMIQLLGSRAIPWTQPLELAGDLKNTAEKTFDPDALVLQASQNRPDLRAAQHRVEQARNQVSLARRNRWFDIAIGTTWVHNFETAGPMGLPSSDFIGATLTINLPITRIWRGELDAAHASEDRSVAEAKSIAVRLESEIRRAVVLYSASAARAKVYTGGGVLADADAVLDKSLFNYQRGGATQIEVLVAQRTVNDVYLSYYDALADSGHAYVEVVQTTGVGDIAF